MGGIILDDRGMVTIIDAAIFFFIIILISTLTLYSFPHPEINGSNGNLLDESSEMALSSTIPIIKLSNSTGAMIEHKNVSIRETIWTRAAILALGGSENYLSLNYSQADATLDDVFSSLLSPSSYYLDIQLLHSSSLLRIAESGEPSEDAHKISELQWDETVPLEDDFAVVQYSLYIY